MSQFEDEILTITRELSNEIDENHKNLIKHVDILREIVDWQIRKTPKELRQRKIDLRNATTIITDTQRQIKGKNCNYDVLILNHLYKLNVNFIFRSIFHVELEETFNDESLKHDEIVENAKLEIDDLAIVIERIVEKHRSKLDHEM